MLFMRPRILSWNVRGLNERDKRCRAGNLHREWKADIAFLQETKLELLSGLMCIVHGAVSM
jgi:exonuclease III